jgi:hypothetical protein
MIVGMISFLIAGSAALIGAWVVTAIASVGVLVPLIRTGLRYVEAPVVLPCRRSRVRVPSSALNAPELGSSCGDKWLPGLFAVGLRAVRREQLEHRGKLVTAMAEKRR